MDTRIERIHLAAEYIQKQIGDLKPVVGIILGSGLGKLANSVKDPIVIPYKNIPGFPSPQLSAIREISLSERLVERPPL